MTDESLLEKVVQNSYVFDGLVNRIPFAVYINADDRDEQLTHLDQSSSQHGPPCAFVTTCEAIRRAVAWEQKQSSPGNKDLGGSQQGKKASPCSRADLQHKIALLRCERRNKEAESKAKKRKRASQRNVLQDDREAAQLDPVENAAPGIDLSFGDFIFKKDEANNKVNRPGTKVRKLESAVKHLREQKRELDDLSDDARRQKEHDLAVKRAVAKAGGTKIKTDETRVQKSLKGLQRKKVKSHEKWAERKDRLEDAQAERQKERKSNITLYRTKAGKAALQSQRDKRHHEEQQEARREKRAKDKSGATSSGAAPKSNIKNHSAESGF